jgi:hypothetical protein
MKKEDDYYYEKGKEMILNLISKEELKLYRELNLEEKEEFLVNKLKEVFTFY